ncbi:mitogen-activated protein kinase [Amphichorda felina]
MAPDWKASLSASERYDAIQRIQSTRGLSMGDAIPIEQQAYHESSTKDEYLSACQPPVSPVVDDEDEPPAEPEPILATGIRIGSYDNCIPIADGLTSEVYRSGSKALKVIIPFSYSMEPHNPQREVRILESLRDHQGIIQLLDVFRDHEQRLVLEFPYMPLTLADLLAGRDDALSTDQLRTIFTDALHALDDIHSQGIIHRDIKPSAILLASPSGPAYLSDFGTTWHPAFSSVTEPPDAKILDIGTGPYRAPEVLFGNKSYGPPVDMWGLGVVLSETIRSPPMPVFESRPAHEDGNQLGLILSIFKTLGTPTPETWPEAKEFKVAPFELWTVFPQRSWEGILPGVDAEFRDLVAALVRFDGRRATAHQVCPAFYTTVTRKRANISML